MINRKNIAPGSTVYVGTRKLQSKHVALFEVDEYVVIKRTSCGYKVNHRGYKQGLLLLDEKTYISTSKEEVAKALIADISERIQQTENLVERLLVARVKLWGICE